MTVPHRDWPEYVCPRHGLRLEPGKDVLVCPEGHDFPLVNGIPRFVAGEDYAAAFGRQWNTYRRTQLDSYSNTTMYRDRLSRCLGEQGWSQLRSAHVLEAGCGAGCFTEIFLAQGARVSSIDLSVAVEANWENFPDREHHRVAQADLRALPFRPASFDIVACLGVVQHTPDPEQTIRGLFEYVRPGGWLVIDHYPRDWKWYTTAKPLYRFVLRRLPSEAGMRWSGRLVRFFLPLHRAARRFRPAQLLLARVSPVFHYYHSHPQLSDQLHYEWALLDTNDAMTDWYKHRRTKAEIRQTLEALGGQDIWCENGGNGVEARIRKRAPA